jgi:HEAT repeat protein
MGYNQEAKEAIDRLRPRLSPEVVEACAAEIARLGPEALKLCLTFPEPLIFAATRHWIVSIALRMPREEAVPVLLEALAHPDWRIFQIARDALAKLGTEVKDELVRNLESCRVPGGRIQTLYCLHFLADPYGPLAIGDQSLIGPIAKVAESDGSPEVRAYAIDVLSRSEAHDAEPTIAKALEDEDESVRLAAMRAAGRLRLKACVPALVQMVDHDDAEVRADVLYALDRIGDVSAAAAARERLKDESFYVRWSAVGALESLWEDANAAALEAAANDAHHVVAAAARDVLDRRA